MDLDRSRKGGAVDALVALKEQGIAESIGIATGNLRALTDYLNTDVFDVLLSHNKYTLLDRSAKPLMDACVHKGVAFLNAAPYGGGLLARGPGATTRYAYAEANKELLKRATELEALCTRHGYPSQRPHSSSRCETTGDLNGVRGVEPCQAGADDSARGTPISAAFWQAAEGLMASWHWPSAKDISFAWTGFECASQAFRSPDSNLPGTGSLATARCGPTRQASQLLS